MKYDDLVQAFADWVILFSGITGDASVFSDYFALLAIPTASRTNEQQALWLQLNSRVINLAQNGPRPSTPYLSTHLQLMIRQGSTPYKSEPILNVSKKATMSSAFITGNSISITINSISIGPVLFTDDNATTYTLIQEAIQTAFPTATIVIDSSSFTFQIYEAGETFSLSVNITGGVSRPSAVISSPYSQSDTTIYYVDKAHLYLQGYGQGSSVFLQNLEGSFFKDTPKEYLKSKGISYLMDSGIHDIHTLVDLTYEERYSFDIVFLVSQIITDVTYDINAASITKV